MTYGLQPAGLQYDTPEGWRNCLTVGNAIRAKKMRVAVEVCVREHRTEPSAVVEYTVISEHPAWKSNV